MQKINMLSIVTPSYNESGCLPGLVQEMEAILPSLLVHCASVEWIVADDGSTDNTAQILDYCPEFVRRLTMEHRGMSAALYEGVMAARGDVIATMDADLQNNPSDLPSMVSVLLSSNADMVCGIRHTRKDGMIKRLSSRVSNQVRRKVLGDTIHDAGCTLRVFRADIRERCFWPIRGGHRFVGPFAQRQGLKVLQIGVSHRQRPAGASHFGTLDRLSEVVFDLAGAAWLMSRAFPPSSKGKNVSTRGEDS